MKAKINLIKKVKQEKISQNYIYDLISKIQKESKLIYIILMFKGISTKIRIENVQNYIYETNRNLEFIRYYKRKLFNRVFNKPQHKCEKLTFQHKVNGKFQLKTKLT